MSVVPPLRPLWPKQLAAACREFAQSEISHNAEAICSLRWNACAFLEFSECARNGFAGLFMFFFPGKCTDYASYGLFVLLPQVAPT